MWHMCCLVHTCNEPNRQTSTKLSLINSIRNLDVEKIELDRVSCVDVLVGEEVLPPQQQSFVGVDRLFSECLVVVQPVHCNVACK